MGESCLDRNTEVAKALPRGVWDPMEDVKGSLLCRVANIAKRNKILGSHLGPKRLIFCDALASVFYTPTRAKKKFDSQDISHA